MNENKFYLLYSLEEDVVETIADKGELEIVLSVYDLGVGSYKLMEFDQLILRDIAYDRLEAYKEAKAEIDSLKDELEDLSEELENEFDDYEVKMLLIKKEKYEEEIKKFQRTLSQNPEPSKLWAREVDLNEYCFGLY